MAEHTNNTKNDSEDISSVLEEIAQTVTQNRAKFDDSDKIIKDWRRIFDQDSSRMNQAIFNDAPQEEIHKETLRTVSILVEILARTKKRASK